MTTQDEIVAQAIEDKPEGSPTERFHAQWPKAWVFLGDEWKPRPFISAPTWELDGIVWEWLRTQFAAMQLDVCHQRRILICERAKAIGYVENPYTKWDIMDLNYGKLGDWARALLQVLEAKDE